MLESNLRVRWRVLGRPAHHHSVRLEAEAPEELVGRDIGRPRVKGDFVRVEPLALLLGPAKESRPDTCPAGFFQNYDVMDEYLSGRHLEWRGRASAPLKPEITYRGAAYLSDGEEMFIRREKRCEEALSLGRINGRFEVFRVKRGM
jgi:hypothetical protein